MSSLKGTYEFTVIVGENGAVSIQNEDASKGYGWGPGTLVATEIIEALNGEGMFDECKS